jgi:Cu-Zn family superoxide dismutase
MQILPVVLAAAAALPIALVAGAGQASATDALTGGGVFGPYASGAHAVRYDAALIPEGASARALAVSGQHTVTRLVVHGLLPRHEYGAHVHTKACGPAPADSGSHYQHVPDPVQPSVDPAYANPANEIWLDFHTDSHGNGVAFSRVDWDFGDRAPGSVVIHATHTHTDPGEAGTAGARLACLNF